MGSSKEAGARVADGGRAFLDATLAHRDAVYRVARHCCADAQLAEDLVQETYLRAFAAFERHDGANTRAWLVTICLNLARSDARRRARRVVEHLGDDLSELEAAGVEVFAVVAARLDRDTVERALAHLSPEQRLAIVLMDLVGHSAAEVARMLDCPRGTVLARVHRGRRKLAAVLVSAGIDHGLS